MPDFSFFRKKRNSQQENPDESEQTVREDLLSPYSTKEILELLEAIKDIANVEIRLANLMFFKQTDAKGDVSIRLLDPKIEAQKATSYVFQQCRDFIGENKLEPVFPLLLEHLKGASQPIQDEITLLRSRYESYRRNVRIGLLPGNEANAEETRIKDAVLEFMNNLVQETE